MKLRNKKTGEIVERVDISIRKVGVVFNNDETYDTLAELNAEWEDYEEPKKFWYMTAWGDVYEYSQSQFAIKQKQDIGNYFESEEEAEQAVEKLKAWKRLKDKGFRFTGWTIDDGLRISICSNIDEEDIYDEDKRKMKPDLDLLFLEAKNDND